MSRFLIVSFSGLALAFYHLSGGADFSPPARPLDSAADTTDASRMSQTDIARLSRAEMPGAEARIEPLSTESLSPALVVRPVQTSPDQPFIPLNTQTTARSDHAESGPQAQPGSLVPALGQPVPTNPSDDLQLRQVAFSLPASGLQIGSLSGGLGAISQTSTSLSQASFAETRPTTDADESEAALDVRHVRASRVNVRFGPGKEFPVVARLLANDAVHVLSDDNSGWVLLTDPKSGQVGWIAASLLSAKGS